MQPQPRKEQLDAIGRRLGLDNPAPPPQFVWILRAIDDVRKILCRRALDDDSDSMWFIPIWLNHSDAKSAIQPMNKSGKLPQDTRYRAVMMSYEQLRSEINVRPNVVGYIVCDSSGVGIKTETTR